MRGLRSILFLFFATSLININNNTGRRNLDSIQHMALKLIAFLS